MHNKAQLKIIKIMLSKTNFLMQQSFSTRREGKFTLQHIPTKSRHAEKPNLPWHCTETEKLFEKVLKHAALIFFGVSATSSCTCQDQLFYTEHYNVNIVK